MIFTLTKNGTTLDLNTDDYSPVGDSSFGAVGRDWSAESAPGMPAPRFGPTTIGPRSIPVVREVTGTSADDLAAKISALIAVLPDDDTPTTVTMGGSGSSYTGTATARRVDGYVEKPYTFSEDVGYRTLVSFTLTCDPHLQTPTETLYDASAQTLPAVVSLSTMVGDGDPALDTELDFDALEVVKFYAGRYPDADATIATFARELVGATWVDVSGTGAAASDDAGYGTAISGNELWGTEGEAYTNIDWSDMLGGEYHFLVNAKSQDGSDPGSISIPGVDAVTVSDTSLSLYSLGTVYLPPTVVRGSVASTLRLTITGAGSGDAVYVNAAFAIPVSWGGLLIFRRSSGHVHTLGFTDDMVFADDVGALGESPGDRRIRGKGGSLVMVAEQATPAPTTAAELTLSYDPLWEQLPSAEGSGPGFAILVSEGSAVEVAASEDTGWETYA